MTAWIDEDEREDVTFAEFRRRARAQADHLRDHGVDTGDRVIIIMPQGIPAMTAFVGAMMLGAVPAILAYPNSRLSLPSTAPGWRESRRTLGQGRGHRRGISRGHARPRVARGGETQLIRACNGSGVKDRELPDSQIRPDSVALIQHSAGTTGLQKGVALTHAAVLTQL